MTVVVRLAKLGACALNALNINTFAYVLTEMAEKRNREVVKKEGSVWRIIIEIGNAKIAK